MTQLTLKHVAILKTGIRPITKQKRTVYFFHKLKQQHSTNHMKKEVEIKHDFT